MQVAKLRFTDPVRVDTERLNRICGAVGATTGEVVINTAMEDLAALMATAHRAWGQSDVDALQPSAVQISGIADRIGLLTLATVAHDVADLCIGGDDAALAATVTRMVRLGEMSLIAVWEAQDVPG